MPVRQNIAVPLTPGKLLSVCFHHFIAVGNLKAGLSETIIGQGFRHLKSIDPFIPFCDLDGLNLLSVFISESYLYTFRAELLNIQIIIPTDSQRDGFMLLVVVVRNLITGSLISFVFRGIPVDRCSKDAVVDLISFVIYGQVTKIEIPGSCRTAGRFFYGKGFDCLSVCL